MASLKRLESIADEWDELDQDYVKLQSKHTDYLKKIQEMTQLQKECVSTISKQRYRMKQIQDAYSQNRQGIPLSEEEILQRGEVLKKTAERKTDFRSMEEFLPHKNGTYLSIILGQVNVSLLSKADRLNYKQEYEKFKLVLNIITFVLSVALYLLPFLRYRFIDAAYHFLFVWYYCTLTIREHILIVNGSKIKGWWLAHHFLSTVGAGLFLVWPEGESYWSFRDQFIGFSLYLSVVQVMQYYYQTGILYRLRALGLRNDMDITIEGFHSWMFKGFSFLLPLLFVGYGFQLFNAYTLFKLFLQFSPDCEWQVPALSLLFTLLAFGNIFTTLIVVKNRFSTKFGDFFTRNRYRLVMRKSKDL